MNIKSALKLKNKIFQDINELKNLIINNNTITHNSINNRIKTIDLIFNLDSKILEFIKLKTEIQKATIPIHEKIFLLSELKGKLDTFKHIQNFGTVLKPELNDLQINNIINDIENKILLIQDELDNFNSLTKI
jgi:hypothetical protein